MANVRRLHRSQIIEFLSDLWNYPVKEKLTEVQYDRSMFYTYIFIKIAGEV